MAILWIILFFCLNGTLFAPDPTQGNIESGYEHFVSHMNDLFSRCERFLGTSDPLVIEDTIMRLEATIRILRISRDSIDPPLSTETQHYLTTLINQVREILAAWRKSACNHRQLGKLYHIDFKGNGTVMTGSIFLITCE